MTRSLSTRLVLGLAVLAAPALFIGCSEESKPAADVPAATSTPAATAAPAAAPGAPGEAPPKVETPAAPSK